MAKISTYTYGTPTLETQLIGTDVNNSNETKNFTIEDLLNLYQPNNLAKGFYFDSLTQTLTGGVNVGVPVILRSIYLQNYMTIVSDGTNLSRITFLQSGYYRISASINLANSAGASQTVDMWLRKNGSTSAANLQDTNRKSQLQSNSNYVLVSFDYILYCNANDYIQLMWAATSTNVTMAVEAANSVHPATPSVSVTINQI